MNTSKNKYVHKDVVKYLISKLPEVYLSTTNVINRKTCGNKEIKRQRYIYIYIRMDLL